MSGLYPSGASSLFSMIARLDPPGYQRAKEKKSAPAVITCPWCMSENTQAVDLEHDIYECLNCGETFTRRKTNCEHADLDA